MGEALVLGLVGILVLAIIVLFSVIKGVPISAKLKAGDNKISIKLGSKKNPLD